MYSYITEKLKELNEQLNKLENYYYKEIPYTLKKYSDNINDGVRSIIGEWYDSYEPEYYKRQYRLNYVYNTIDLTSFPKKYNFTLKPRSNVLYGYRADSDYILDITVMRGYHGGATDGYDVMGNPHPNPPTPYYRTGKNFAYWGRPAVHTWSINDRVQDYFERTISELDNKIYNGIMKILEM